MRDARPRARPAEVPRSLRTAHVVVAASLLATAGCAATRIEDGRYRSPKGYQVAVPPNGWMVVNEDDVDLVLRHEQPPARMLVNASCDETVRTRSGKVLARHLLMGLKHRTVVERDEVPVGGRPAIHLLLEGEDGDQGTRVRVDAYVVKTDRCVYDFLYVAPAASFAAGREDFRHVVESFRME